MILSFTSFSMASFSSLNSCNSWCEALSAGSNTRDLSLTVSVVCFFPLWMDHFAVLCMIHNFVVLLKARYFR